MEILADIYRRRWPLCGLCRRRCGGLRVARVDGQRQVIFGQRRESSATVGKADGSARAGGVGGRVRRSGRLEPR